MQKGEGSRCGFAVVMRSVLQYDEVTLLLIVTAKEIVD